MTEYPTSFTDILKDPDLVKKLNFECHFSNPSYQDWKSQREFIAKAITKNGTIMDIGCANGWLLRCLQEWTSYSLEPYGIDTNSRLLEEAKRLFKSYKDHFKKLSLFKFKYRWIVGLPRKYDFVIWNVGDNWDFEEQGIREIEVFMNSLEAQGKLIMTFYDDPERSDVKIAFLQRAFPINNLIASSSGRQKAFVLAPSGTPR